VQTPGAVTEQPISIDPSQLLEVVSCLKHGQVLAWPHARKVWAQKPISNVELFGLLVTTWPAFLNVRAHRGTYATQAFARGLSPRIPPLVLYASPPPPI
jgi:hypothetical protein